jgi:hypothetical protein
MRLIDADLIDEQELYNCESVLEAIDYIMEQPTVNTWIPCSERLPTKEEYCKNDGRFIVSNGIKSYECTFDVYEEIFKQFEYNRKGIWMEYVDDKVIAWQPLPKPFKEAD